MKSVKYYSLLTVLAVVSLLSSCTFHSPDEISSRDIVKEFNRQLEERVADISALTIEVGTYECNDEAQRYLLRELEAAGLITYNVERLAWWEKEVSTKKRTYTEYERYGWMSYPVEKTRWEESVDYNFENHYIVTVALTDDGKNIVIDEMPEPAVDEDMEQPEVDSVNYAWNKTDLSEVWPEIKNPFLKKEKTNETNEESYYKPDDSSASKPAQTAQEPKGNIKRIDEAQYRKYKALVESRTEVMLLAYKTEAQKARKIQISKSEDGISKATAELIVEVVDVTNAGRITNEVEEGKKIIIPVSLTYYLDKGWVID